MASNTEIIDGLVSASDIKAVNDLNVKVIESGQVLESYLSKITDVNKILSQATVSHQNLTKAIGDHEKMLNEINDAQQFYNKSVDELNKKKAQIISDTSKEVVEIEKKRKAVEEETVTRKANTTAVIEGNKAISKSEKELSAISVKSREDAVKSLDKQRQQYVAMQLELKGVQSEMNILEKQQQMGSISIEDYTAKKAKLSDVEQNQKIAVKQLGDTIKYNNTIISTSIGSYDNLSAVYSKMKMDINGMSDAETKNGLTKKQLEAQSKTLYEEMSRLQKQTGKSQLDVGKYENAMIGAASGNSKFGKSMLTAMSDGKGMAGVVDLIKGKTQALFAVMIANPIIAIIAAVVAILMAMKKAINSSEEATDKLNKVLAPLGWIMDKLLFVVQKIVGVLLDGAIAAQNFAFALVDMMESLPFIGGAIKEANKEMKKSVELEDRKIALVIRERKELVETAKRSKEASALRVKAEQESLYSAEERLKFIQDANALEKESAKQAKEIAVERYKQAKEEADRAENNTETQEKLAQLEADMHKAEENYSNKSRRLVSKEESFKKEIANNNKARNDKAIADAKAKSDAIKTASAEERKALEDLASFRTNSELDSIRLVIDSNKTSYNERMQSISSYEKKFSDSIIRNRDFQLTNDKLTAYQRKLIEEKAQAELTKIVIEGDKMRAVVIKDTIDMQSKALEKSLGSKMDNLGIDEDMALNELSSLYARQSITKEEHEERRYKIQVEYEKKRFEAELAHFDAILSLSGLSAEQLEEIERKKANAILKFNKSLSQQEIDENKKKGDKLVEQEKAFAQKRKELMKELHDSALDLMFSLSDKQLSHEERKLEKQTKQNDKWREDELEKIQEQEDSGLISKEQSEARKKVIDDIAQEQAEELEEKQAQLEKKKAQREKMIALAQIAIKTAKDVAGIKTATALAVAQAMALSPLTFGQPWAGVALAQGATNVALALGVGAVQAGIVASTPAYKDGTDNHKGGPAIVGDGGRSEMVLTPDGKVLKTPGVPTLVDLPKHSIVLPDFEKALVQVGVDKFSQESNKPIVIIDNNKQLNLTKKSNDIMRNVASGQKAIVDAIKTTKKGGVKW